MAESVRYGASVCFVFCVLLSLGPILLNLAVGTHECESWLYTDVQEITAHASEVLADVRAVGHKVAVLVYGRF